MDTAYIYLLSAAEEGGMCTEVRRAMNLAIDRDEIIDKILGGEGRPLHSTFSPVRSHQCVLTSAFSPESTDCVFSGAPGWSATRR